MPNLVLLMQREAIAQALMMKLRDSPSISLIYESDYNYAEIAINSTNAKAVLIEVVESGPYDIGYCLKLCKEIRKNIPRCKLILMCPEQDEKSVRQVVGAKAENKIDDFVFYDVTIDYLASKLMSI
ncbi:MAG TPA: hypothetical protein VFC79_01305 [Tissierellaceae bacterium]|nr:hypothetical protein [Tissierellaceae bacterium]